MVLSNILHFFFHLQTYYSAKIYSTFMHLFFYFYTGTFVCSNYTICIFKSKLQSRKNYHTKCCVCNLVSAEYSFCFSDLQTRSTLEKQRRKTKQLLKRLNQHSFPHIFLCLNFEEIKYLST
uniref:Uncharacterized protein n=1 Tax=Pipistrellus kuhlii TaxID=59472 RepID=A0A7J8B0V4_PIPKU|nr:hypothetical protein mPipKuh1_007652 [Pipistrellus kuhlii]